MFIPSAGTRGSLPESDLKGNWKSPKEDAELIQVKVYVCWGGWDRNASYKIRYLFFGTNSSDYATSPHCEPILPIIL